MAGIRTLLPEIAFGVRAVSWPSEPVSARSVQTPAPTESNRKIHERPIMHLAVRFSFTITSLAKVISMARTPVASVISCFDVSEALANAALVCSSMDILNRRAKSDKADVAS